MSFSLLFIGYFVCINVWTFGIWGWDKRMARQSKWRVREKTLYQYMIRGGRLGALIGMEFFRHKTIKGAFLGKFRIIVTIRIIVLGYALFSLQKI